MRFARGDVIRRRNDADIRYIIVSRDDYNEKSLTRIMVEMSNNDVATPFDIYSKRYDAVVRSTSLVTLKVESGQFITEGRIEKRVLSEVIENLKNLLGEPARMKRMASV